MKILITGGSGFIGSHLIRTLLSQNPEVQIINLDTREPSIEDQRLQFWSRDIRSEKELLELDFGMKFDLCIHLAALCKEPGYEWEEYFMTNHLGTINVIKLCEIHEIDSIFFTSTMMVYKADEIERTEESITAPDTAYGISKLLAEKELEKWKNRKGNRSLKVVRPAVVFGENENANFTRLYRSLRNGFFPYIGKSTTVKSCIYVKELVKFLIFLIKKETNEDLYNLAFPEDQSIKKIVASFNLVFELRAFSPVLPFRLMIIASYLFEFLNKLGVKNSIHHRRIQKLFFSTYIYPTNVLKEGYDFEYDLEKSLRDWKASNDAMLRN